MKLFLGLCLTILLISCGSVSESDCRNSNLYELGLEHGREGIELSEFGDFSKSCAKNGVILETSEYKKGRSRGLERYCTKANGYKVYKNDLDYKDVCPRETEEAFLKGMSLAKKEEKLEKKKKKMAKKAKELEEERRKLEEEQNKIKDNM